MKEGFIFLVLNVMIGGSCSDFGVCSSLDNVLRLAKTEFSYALNKV